MPGLVVKPRARILHGHDWVLSGEILKVFGNPADGDVISLKDGRDRLLGSAIYNSKSQIVARRFSRRKQELDLNFFQRRIAQAAEYRDRRGVNPRLCRIVWSESDGLPGVIVDRYGDNLVLQTLTLAMDLRKTLIVEALQAAFDAKIDSIIERNDAAVRRAEGRRIRFHHSRSAFLHENEGRFARCFAWLPRASRAGVQTSLARRIAGDVLLLASRDRNDLRPNDLRCPGRRAPLSATVAAFR